MIKKLNRNGFTLVEILVTMVILGIVTAMAFPVLKTVSENNTENDIGLGTNCCIQIISSY